MSVIKVLFLGAGRRLSLLERFLDAAQLEGVEIELFSAEISKMVPIAGIAKILESPKFSDPIFAEWLFDLVGEEKINIIIPNMDAATVALSSLKEELLAMGVWPVVSSELLCISMEDKVLADNWFRAQGIPVPGCDRFPRILKPRKGFGGKSQEFIADSFERSKVLKKIQIHNFIEQEFLSGQEFSVDAYISRTGKFIAAMPRLRIRVLDGEVDESLSVEKPEIEKLTKYILGCSSGWEGPITLQFIEDVNGLILIEINPRFGGGVTHSIHCGLNMPQWILREWAGRDLPVQPAWKNQSFMTRCRRDIFL